MPKFKVGQWVRRHERDHRGVVRGHRAKSTLVCWIGSKKATATATKTLRHAIEPAALVLEGSLDRDLVSRRSEEALLRTWFESVGLPLAYKNIHSLDDIRLIARAMRGCPPPFVHISCHGDHDAGRAYLSLAPKALKEDRVYLDDERTVRIFEDAFSGLPVLFSACFLGRYGDQVATFRAQAKLSNVAAFTGEVSDSETMIFELMLYQGMLFNGCTFATAVDNACEAMRTIGVIGTPGKHQKLVRMF